MTEQQQHLQSKVRRSRCCDYVRLNQIGAHYLHRGMVDRAIACFQMGLSRLRNRMSRDAAISGGGSPEHQATDTSSHPPPRNSMESITSVVQDHRLLVIRTPSSSSTSGQFSSPLTDHNPLLLHETPFLFLCTDNASTGSHEQTTRSVPLVDDDPCMTQDSYFSSTVSAVVIFNLALSFHCEAIQAGQEMSEFVRIQRLYWNAVQAMEKSLLLLQQAGKEPQAGNPSVLHSRINDMTRGGRRLLCAAYNNMAHVSSRFLDLATTRSHLNSLRVLLLRDYWAQNTNSSNQDLFNVLFRDSNGWITLFLTRHGQGEQAELKENFVIAAADKHFVWNISTFEKILTLSPAA